MDDTQSIVSFGSARRPSCRKSPSHAAGVRNKDVGPAGDSLRGIVTTIRGFSVSELDVRRERTWWEKLLGRAAPFAKFTARFETVQAQIDKVTDDLLQHEHALLKDIKSLDMLYDKTLRSTTSWRFTSPRARKSSRARRKDIPAKEAEVERRPRTIR